jgi:ABC-type dipeptide/oligopeptide/nickel transport system permease component
MWRLLLALPVIASVLVVSFFLTHVVPGDPITALVGDYPAPAEYVAQIRSRYGLDQSLPVQFAFYAGNLLRGDLGFSFANQQPVLSLVLGRAGKTLLLMIPALVLASAIGVLLGMLAATRKSRVADAALSSMSMLGFSIPVFWLGQILIIVFAVQLKWLPAQGMVSVRGVAPGAAQVVDFLAHWVLPGFAATLFYSAVVARVARSSVLEALNQDFVTTARAKGLPESIVLRRHVLPNAVMPIISVIGYNFGSAITGTILIEAVFAWPGLGHLFVSAIGSRDYPVLQGIFLFAAIAVIAANLITDLLYVAIDPRIRDVRAGT